MIFSQVVPKNWCSCGNRTIWGNRPSLIMQAYITICFGFPSSRARHKKSIVNTHFEYQQTFYILCYKSIFKLCMIFKTEPLTKTFMRNVKKYIVSLLAIYLTLCCYTCSCLLPEICRLCAYISRLWAGIRG